MSSPDANTETRRKRLRWLLVGAAVVVLAVVIGYFATTTWLFDNGGTPAGPDAVIDGRTSQPEDIVY